MADLHSTVGDTPPGDAPTADRSGAGTTPDPAVLAGRLSEVWDRIEGAGGSKETVSLVAVTKTFPIGHVESGLTAGLIDFGENYAQELVAKDDAATAAGLSPRWHFIGGLQRNKVKLLVGRVHLWQTVDRKALVDEIAKRTPGARILVQVNTTGEDQKSGCQPVDTAALVDRGRTAGLAVEGLMTIGPTGGGDPRPSFDVLRELGRQNEVRQLSMGMSADYELAVEAGSTMVRIGAAIFGPRSPRA
jgi:pyridoxal phosphate enzyme (YggS family)